MIFFFDLLRLTVRKLLDENPGPAFDFIQTVILTFIIIITKLFNNVNNA